MPLPLKGKYDKRYKIKAKPIDDGSRINAGRKPDWAKHLTKNTAAHVLKQVDAKAVWLQLLGTNDAKLRFEVLRYLTDRLEGRPFVAVNPLESKAPSVLNQDNRLQVSIQQLLPAAKPAKKRKVIAAQLVESTDAIQAAKQSPPASQK